jgi:hypothetical protein
MPENLNPNPIQPTLTSCGSVRVETHREISIPATAYDREMAVRCTDWDRLQRRLTARLADPKNYSTLYGILFGLGGSTGLSIIPLENTTGLPPWVLPLYYVATVALFAGGLFVLHFDRQARRTRQTEMTDLLDDVKEIGSRFPTLGPPQAQEAESAEPASADSRMTNVDTHRPSHL